MSAHPVQNLSHSRAEVPPPLTNKGKCWLIGRNSVSITVAYIHPCLIFPLRYGSILIPHPHTHTRILGPFLHTSSQVLHCHVFWTNAKHPKSFFLNICPVYLICLRSKYSFMLSNHRLCRLLIK